MVTLAQTQTIPDPSDPGVSVPPARYESVFNESSRVADSPLPWKRLFKSDGSFVPESQLDGSETAVQEPMVNVTEGEGEPGSSQSGSDAQGVVKAIYPERNKIKLRHGPIAKLDMPGMTMVFRVEDPALLDSVKAGDEVGFTMEMQGSAFVITGFQPVAGSEAKLAETQAMANPNSERTDANGSMRAEGVSDARGVVKSIYHERSKVKLKHGPIEKLDMPGMTMVFRVNDPALLQDIEEGDQVGFTVEMQGSAFVVTGFQK